MLPVQELVANHLKATSKRLHDLEEIANSFEGVQNSFALQAGREIRIMVNPGQIKDDKVTILAHKVREKSKATSITQEISR